jgi:hypothetical protein
MMVVEERKGVGKNWREAGLYKIIQTQPKKLNSAKNTNSTRKIQTPPKKIQTQFEVWENKQTQHKFD